MARMNDDGQWIIMMGFIVAVSLMFLAVVINESTLVGQTTAESVLDFSKPDIKDIRSEVLDWNFLILKGETSATDIENIRSDIKQLALSRKNAVVDFSENSTTLVIHYNNGVTKYDEQIKI